MKNIKIALLIMAFVLVLGAGIPKIAKAQTSASVSTTVTVGTVSVTVSPASFSYGNMTLSATKTSFVALSSSNIGATVGGVVTDLDIYTTETTSPDSGTAWTLDTSISKDHYTHGFKTVADGTTDPGTSGFTLLTTSGQDLYNDLPINAVKYFALQISTPSSVSSSDAVQTAVVTVLATYGL